MLNADHNDRSDLGLARARLQRALLAHQLAAHDLEAALHDVYEPAGTVGGPDPMTLIDPKLYPRVQAAELELLHARVAFDRLEIEAIREAEGL